MIRVLIIAYYWPPAGGPGVQRWLNFVRHLPQFGIEPIVYVPQNPSYPLLDDSLRDNVPDVEILKQPISEPYKIATLFSKRNISTISSGLIPKKSKQSLIQKALLFIRGNFFIPDARKNWVMPSVRYLSEYLKHNSVDAIITTGPPHSLHLIGLELQEKFNLKWIADFRDPWTTIGYHDKLRLMDWAKQKHKRLERHVLNAADHIITTSFTTKSEFLEKTTKTISVITNGYNSSDVDTHKPPDLDSNFTIAHIGSLLAERNPLFLWKALKELVSTNQIFAERLELKLAGTISEEVLQSIAEFGLSKYVTHLGYLSHKEAFNEMRNSQVLVLIEIDSEFTKGIIPGKLFEYLLAGRPILAIGPNNWDVEQIILDTNAGKTFNYDSKEAIKKELLTFFELYKIGSLQVISKNISQYSREKLTKQLSELIKTTIQ